MRYISTFAALLILIQPAFAQTAQTTQPARQTTVPQTQQVIQYDPSVLRKAGNTVPIGIVTINGNRDTTRTRGYLAGKDKWTHYRIEATGGASFSNGKVHIKKDSTYQKGDSITLNVYTRKWLLGGKGKWLFSQKIPYNYETAIDILTTGNSRAPGDHIQFGIRTTYDNKMFIDKWAPAKKNLKAFTFQGDGIHISSSKGDLKIDNDPTKITNDKVQLIAALKKEPAIKDTLQLTLNYIANYQCKIQSNTQGHNLYITAAADSDTLIHAQLLNLRVYDSTAKKTYNYRVNTNGGTIAISTKGADGNSGRNGFDGSPGSNGSDGITSVDVETTTDANGNPQTTTTTTQGPGGNGGNGGDGENGEDGDNGSNGGNILLTYTPATQPFLSLIHLLSIPGNGGIGGLGGHGGTGGSGGSGNPPGSSGSRGMDGRSGFDGASGKKGTIRLITQ